MQAKNLDSSCIRHIMEFKIDTFLSKESLEDAFFSLQELTELSLKEQFFNFKAIAFGKYDENLKLKSLFYATVGEYSTGLLNIMMRCCYDKENIEEFIRNSIKFIKEEYKDEYSGMKINIKYNQENYKSLVEAVGFEKELVFPKYTISEIPIISYKLIF